MSNLKIKPQGYMNAIACDASNTCPYCGYTIVPTSLVSHMHMENGKQNLSSIMVCPHCQSSYLEKFTYDRDLYKSTIVHPTALPVISFPDSIESDFPDFVQVYKESAIAEAYNLSSICGMGYRKALEILVKQYAIECYPNDQSAIEKEFISATIKRFQMPELTALATAAVWLGNDHAHMITKHPEYDINELKSFINSICSFIAMKKNFAIASAFITASKSN